MINKKLRKILLSTALCTSLAACGGGSGGPGSVVLENTRNAIESLNSALMSATGGSSTIESSTIGTSITNLASISSQYKLQNSDRDDAKLIVSFFTEWENFNTE